MTNADKIRSMTDEDLKDFFDLIVACPPKIEGTDKCKSHNGFCYECWCDWLNQEAEEDENHDQRR